MKKFFYLFIIIIFFISGCPNSNNKNKGQKNTVNLNKLTAIDQKSSLPQIKTFNVAISAMMSPVQNYDVYKPFLKYLQGALQMPVKLVQRKTYKEINNLLKENRVDLAFICTGAYVYGDLKNTVNVIAIPEVKGKITYNAFIITHRPSIIKSIWGLKGKSFAFMDPLSNTGYFYPIDLFKHYDINPKTFFSKTTFTYSHTYSIEAVAHGVVSAASVDGIVYNYTLKEFPQLKQSTKILFKSPPFAMPPVVVPKNINSNLQKKIQSILINMDKNESGKQILRQIGVDRFVLPPKNFYNSIYYFGDNN